MYYTTAQLNTLIIWTFLTHREKIKWLVFLKWALNQNYMTDTILISSYNVNKLSNDHVITMSPVKEREGDKNTVWVSYACKDIITKKTETMLSH